MFWNSHFFWYSFAIILILAVFCLVVAIYIRRKRQENKFTVEIENRGNVASQYLLRLANDDHLLVYRFTTNGNRLPVEVIPGIPGSSQVAPLNAVGVSGAKLGEQAQSASNTVQQYAPSGVSQPLVNANSTLYKTQTIVGQAQYYLRKLGFSGDSSNKPEPQAETPPADDRWAVTGKVQPGKVLPVEMVVRKKHVGDARQWVFQLISRPKQNLEAPAVFQEVKGKVPTGFWMHPVFPELTILGSAFSLVCIMVILTIIFHL